jgi:hypothetical protein
MGNRRTSSLLALFGVVAGIGCGEQPSEGDSSSVIQRRVSALDEPTVTVTVELGGYLGSINIGAFPAAGQGTAYAVTLPSGEHDINTPLAFDETGSTKLATLTVDAVAGTVSLVSDYFQPVAPADRVLHLKTIVFPYDVGDSAIFGVGLLGVGSFSGGGGVYDVHVLDNRRYQLLQSSSLNRDGTSSTFSPAPDVLLRHGCPELSADAPVTRSFSVESCRLRPRLTTITVAAGTDVPLALLGVATLPPGKPFKVVRERLYRFTGPSSLDLVTGAAEFSDRSDLFVGQDGSHDSDGGHDSDDSHHRYSNHDSDGGHDSDDVARFLDGTKASKLFSVRNRVITPVVTSCLTFDDSGSITDLEIADGYPIDHATLIKGRRYVAKAVRSWDPDDLVSQNFIAGRFGADPGLIIGDDGRLTVTDAVSKHFRVLSSPPRLTAKVGNIHFTVHGCLDEKVRVDARILDRLYGHCGTRVLTGRLHQIALIGANGSPVASTNFTMGYDGRCSPQTVTFPQGSIDLGCSL